MTILQLINSEKVSVLHVNVIKQIDSTHYVVADQTGMAIMITDEQANQFIEIGKGLKMVKPSRIDENTISTHPKFKPMKTKATQMDVDFDQIKELEKKIMPRHCQNNSISFNKIETDFADNAIIDQILVYVTSASRIIDGKYGEYQICNIVDTDGSSIAINLYKSNINKLVINKVYKISKIKKTNLSNDNKLRIATTNFTKIVDGSQGELDFFKDVKIADEKIDGIYLMFNNLHHYKSCKKHQSKLDDSGNCNHCKNFNNQDEKTDFVCSLVLEKSEDEMPVEIAIFRRHLDIAIDENLSEPDLIEFLEQLLVGKQCQVDYNVVGSDNNVAIRLIIL